MSCRVQADFRAVNRPLIPAYQRLRSRRGVANSTVACGPHSAWDSLITRYYSSRSYALTATTLPPGLVNVNGQAVVSVPSMLCMKEPDQVDVVSEINISSTTVYANPEQGQAFTVH